MLREVKIETALGWDNVQFIDVRSEHEFAAATIPGAINLPILNDQERAEVGTIYHQQSTHAARLRALEIAGPKLLFLVQQIEVYAHEGPVVLFCWRGGMRSRSVGLICDLMDIPASRLLGGYKAYRRWVYQKLWQQEPIPEMVILHGLTGVGKTEVLELLEQQGLPVINLEQIASNRGSVFGGIGLPPGPSQKMFEGYLAEKLCTYSQKNYILVECESRRIGRNLLPTPFLGAMNKGKHILLYANLEKRIERLVRVYIEETKGNPDAGLSRALETLRKRLGNEQVNGLIGALKEKNYLQIARELLLDYYDPQYKYPDRASADYDFCVEVNQLPQAAEEIHLFLQKSYPR